MPNISENTNTFNNRIVVHPVLRSGLRSKILWPVAKTVEKLTYFFLKDVLRYRKSIIVNNLNASSINEDPNYILKKHYAFLSELTSYNVYKLLAPAYPISKHFHPADLQDQIDESRVPTCIWTAHYNNWEWAGTALSHFTDRPIRLVYQKQKGITQLWLNRLRTSSGATVVSQKELLRSINLDREAGNRALYVILCDQGPVFVEKSYWITFLGRTTPFLSGPERLARRYSLPVYYAAIYGCHKKYFVNFHKIDLKDHPKEGQMTLAYAQHLEKTIKKSPDRWLWSHRRWKRAHRIDEVISEEYLLLDE